MIPATIDAAYVVERLEEAGRTLMALPSNAPQLGQRVRLRRPDAATIARMKEAHGWLLLIGNQSIRKIVGMRSIVTYATGDPAYSWVQIGRIANADYRTVQGWYAEALETIVGKLASS